MEESWPSHPNRNSKAVFGWTMYDWANSVYSLTITTAIFPDYFTSVSQSVALNKEALEAGLTNQAIVPFFGLELKSSALYSFSLSFAYLLIAVLSPILGAIADYSGSKKKFMIAFCLIGSASCSGMYFFDESTYELGVFLFAIAALGFAGGNIFNDAFLPEIVTPDRYDSVSARGYSMGYVGSVILLLFNLYMVLNPEVFFSGEKAVIKAIQFSFLTVGIWWFGFAQITFFTLKDVKPTYKPKNYISSGFKELKKVLRSMRNHPEIRLYLWAFFFFNMGIQTVMYMAAIFGKEDIHLETPQLIISMLLIQLVAIPGSVGFAYLSSLIGNLRTLLVGISTWILILIAAYWVDSATEFYVIGGCVGLIMGGMQALARATYSKFLPETKDTASFFSFYSIMDKVSIIFGTLSFGLIAEFIGTRSSIQALILFFLIGGTLISLLQRKKVLNNR